MGFRIGDLASSAFNPTRDGHLRASVEGKPSNDVETPTEKDVVAGTGTSVTDRDSDEDSLEKIDTNAEHGVQRVQAMTHVWSKRDLILAYIA